MLQQTIYQVVSAVSVGVACGPLPQLLEIVAKRLRFERERSVESPSTKQRSQRTRGRLDTILSIALRSSTIQNQRLLNRRYQAIGRRRQLLFQDKQASSVLYKKNRCGPHLLPQFLDEDKIVGGISLAFRSLGCATSNTQGGSRVRESRTLGSVRSAMIIRTARYAASGDRSRAGNAIKRPSGFAVGADVDDGLPKYSDQRRPSDLRRHIQVLMAMNKVTGLGPFYVIEKQVKSLVNAIIALMEALRVIAGNEDVHPRK